MIYISLPIVSSYFPLPLLEKQFFPSLCHYYSQYYMLFIPFLEIATQVEKAIENLTFRDDKSRHFLFVSLVLFVTSSFLF